MRSSGYIFKAGQKAPPKRARLDPYCRAQRPLFLSHPPWARALHPPQGPKRGSDAPSTGWAGVVSPGRHHAHQATQGGGLFCSRLSREPRPGARPGAGAGGAPGALVRPGSSRHTVSSGAYHSFPEDPHCPRTCRVGMVRPAQVREAVTMPTQPPAPCPKRHRATPGEYERHFLPCVFDDSKKNPQSRVKSLCSPPSGRPWTAEPLFLLSGCAHCVRKGGRYGI